jgi:biopolymer transport protein ExbD
MILPDMRKTLRNLRPELNITSMLDVVFNLIFFFVLIANFAAAERVALEVPKPDNSIAKMQQEADRIVVSVLPDRPIDDIRRDEQAGRHVTTRAGLIRFGVEEFKPGATIEVTRGGQKVRVDRLAYLLEQEVRRDKNVLISVRADKSIRYGDMPAIMNAIAAANVKKISIVAKVTE